ncbi:MAG: hypothetical protein ABIF10_02345 [Candidatus Woesearchaeota archaeon]
MRINGFIYLVVGTGVAIISKTVNSTKFVLFIYLGIGFALYGIFKIAKDGRKKSIQPAQPTQQLNGNHYVTRHHKVTRDHKVSMHYCRFCGNALRYYDNFCPRCGQRVYR